MYKRMLVPINGSDTSMLGVREAWRLPRADVPRLRFLNVIDDRGLARSVDMFAIGDTGSLTESLRAAGEKARERAYALARRRGIECERVLRESRGRSVSRRPSSTKRASGAPGSR